MRRARYFFLRLAARPTVDVSIIASILMPAIADVVDRWMYIAMLYTGTATCIPDSFLQFSFLISYSFLL